MDDAGRARIDPLPSQKGGWVTVEKIELAVTIDVAAGAFRFEWVRLGSSGVLARGRLTPTAPVMTTHLHAFDWFFEREGQCVTDQCGPSKTSIHAMLKRIRLSSEYEVT